MSSADRLAMDRIDRPFVRDELRTSEIYISTCLAFLKVSRGRKAGFRCPHFFLHQRYRITFYDLLCISPLHEDCDGLRHSSFFMSGQDMFDFLTLRICPINQGILASGGGLHGKGHATRRRRTAVQRYHHQYTFVYVQHLRPASPPFRTFCSY